MGPRLMDVAPLADVGVAHAPADGERVSGDDHVVVRCRDGLLVAAIDGLGHGAPAREAARLAALALRERRDEDPCALLAHCHAALEGTRGAAITLARIDVGARTLAWVGVGNVEGRLLRARPGARGEPVAVSALLLGGVVGAQLPPLRALSVALEPGDTLLLATDGVSAGIADGLRVHGSLQPLADGLLRRHRRGGEDDALVLLVRLRDAPSAA